MGMAQHQLQRQACAVRTGLAHLARHGDILGLETGRHHNPIDYLAGVKFNQGEPLRSSYPLAGIGALSWARRRGGGAR